MLKRRRYSLIALAVLLGGALLLWALVTSQVPDVKPFAKGYPVVLERFKDTPPRWGVSQKRPAGWVSLGEISREASGAILVSEDWAFFEHPGFDANQIGEALKESVNDGHLARGASTITQQVAKNLFLTHERSLIRKLRELAAALELERHVGKKRIFEFYLNIAEMGEGIYGVRPAAQRYFGKSPSQLTAKEGAYLAMLLPSPKRYSRSFRDGELSDFNRKTMGAILDKMVQARYLSPEGREVARHERLGFEKVAAPLPAAEVVPAEFSQMPAVPAELAPVQGSAGGAEGGDGTAGGGRSDGASGGDTIGPEGAEAPL